MSEPLWCVSLLHVANTVLRPVVRTVNDSGRLLLEVAMRIALTDVLDHRIAVAIARVAGSILRLSWLRQCPLFQGKFAMCDRICETRLPFLKMHAIRRLHFSFAGRFGVCGYDGRCCRDENVSVLVCVLRRGAWPERSRATCFTICIRRRMAIFIRCGGQAWSGDGVVALRRMVLAAEA